MSGADYRKRRAAGKCVGSRRCRRRLASVCMCAKHLKARRGKDHVWRVREYQRRKAEGLCVANSCKERQQEHSLRCPKHEEKFRAWSRESAAKARRENVRKGWVARKLAQGLCSYCGAEPLVNKRYGENCGELLRMRQRARWLKAHPNAITREKRAVRDLRLEDFISSGESMLAGAQR